jgi:hypothetical protein
MRLLPLLTFGVFLAPLAHAADDLVITGNWSRRIDAGTVESELVMPLSRLLQQMPRVGRIKSELTGTSVRMEIMILDVTCAEMREVQGKMREARPKWPEAAGITLKTRTGAPCKEAK